jgi:hypothetical protein
MIPATNPKTIIITTGTGYNAAAHPEVALSINEARRNPVAVPM